MRLIPHNDDGQSDGVAGHRFTRCSIAGYACGCDDRQCVRHRKFAVCRIPFQTWRLLPFAVFMHFSVCAIGDTEPS